MEHRKRNKCFCHMSKTCNPKISWQQSTCFPLKVSIEGNINEVYCNDNINIYIYIAYQINNYHNTNQTQNIAIIYYPSVLYNMFYFL